MVFLNVEEVVVFYNEGGGVGNGIMKIKPYPQTNST
jgi:hypothetical protein